MRVWTSSFVLLAVSWKVIYILSFSIMDIIKYRRTGKPDHDIASYIIQNKGEY